MSEDTHRLDAGVGFGIIFLALGIVGMALPQPTVGVPPDFSLDGWQPDLERLAPIAAADRKLAATVKLDAAAQKALVAFTHFGSLEAQVDGNAANKDYAVATQAVVKAMLEYYYDKGDDAFRALGVRAADTFMKVATQVLLRATQSNLDVRRWVREHADDPAVKQLVAYCGNFLDHAVAWGLITDGNRLAGGTPFLLRLHFKLRWLRFINSIQDYTLLMHPEELRALWRWRIEGDRNLAMAHRLQVVKWLKNIEPDYPGFAVLGALFAQRGQYREAIAMYREALLDAPFDRRSQINLAYLIRVARQKRAGAGG